MGTPGMRRGIGRLGLRGGATGDGGLLARLLRELPGVDVRVVADPTLRGRPAANAVPPGEIAGD
jgi:hypothetical protein